MILDDIEVILQSVRPSPLGAVGLRHRTSIGAVLYNIRIPGMLQTANIAIGIVDTEVRTEEHALNRGDVNIGVGKDAPLLQTIILVMIELTHGVLAVAHSTYRTRESLTVDLVYGQCGGNLQGILQRSTVHIIRIREGGILTYADDFIDLIYTVEASCEVFEVCIFQHSQSLFIACREEGGSFICCLREGYIIVLCDTSTADFIYPVGIAIWHGLLGIHITVVVTTYGI